MSDYEYDADCSDSEEDEFWNDDWWVGDVETDDAAGRGPNNLTLICPLQLLNLGLLDASFQETVGGCRIRTVVHKVG